MPPKPSTDNPLLPLAVVLPPHVRVPTISHKADGRSQIKDTVAGSRLTWTKATDALVTAAWLRDVHPELLPASRALQTGASARPATVGDLLARYETWLGEQADVGGKARKTHSGYSSVIRRLLTPALVTAGYLPDGKPYRIPLPSVGFDELTAGMVDDLLVWVRNEAPRQDRGAEPGARGLSASQAAQARTALSAAYTWAMRKQKWISENPVRAAENPNVEIEPARAEDIPNPAQVRKFLEGQADDHLLAYWLLAFTTGARAGELSGVKEDSLLFREGAELPTRVWLRNQAQLVDDPRTGVREWGTPPNKRYSRRILGLTEATARALLAAADATAARRAQHPEWDHRWDGYIFRRGDGTPYPSDEIGTLFSERLEKAKLPHWGFHKATRHFAASTWIAAGHTMLAVARRLGHRTTVMVERVYGHLFDEVDPAAVRDMERMLREWLPSDERDDPGFE